MTSISSLSYLCAKTIALDPTLHEERAKLDQWASHPASKIYRDILSDSIQSYCNRVDCGKKILQLAEMGIIDIHALFFLVKEKLEKNSTGHVKSFQLASEILRHTILDTCQRTKEARAQIFQVLNPKTIAKIQRLFEDVQKGHIELKPGDSVPEYGEKHYKLLSDDPL